MRFCFQREKRQKDGVNDSSSTKRTRSTETRASAEINKINFSKLGFKGELGYYKVRLRLLDLVNCMLPVLFIEKRR
jgi:hypothetical protein